MNNNFFKIALLGAVLVSQPLDAKEIDKNTAKLQAMNKLTGRVSVIDVPVNGEVEFGSFSIVVRSRKTRPPEETPDNFAFVDVVDKHEDGSLLNIFKGWMVSSSPALNAVAHPIYDVWLLQCVDTEVDKNKLLRDDELLKRDEIPMKQQETASDGDDAAKGGIEDVLDVEISPMPAALQEDNSQPLDEKIQTNDEMTSSTEENASENQEKKQTVEKSEAVSVEPAVSEDEKLKVFFTQESDEDENNDGKPETLIFEPSLDTLPVMLRKTPNMSLIKQMMSLSANPFLSFQTMFQRMSKIRMWQRFIRRMFPMRRLFLKILRMIWIFLICYNKKVRNV